MPGSESARSSPQSGAPAAVSQETTRAAWAGPGARWATCHTRRLPPRVAWVARQDGAPHRQSPPHAAHGEPCPSPSPAWKAFPGGCGALARRAQGHTAGWPRPSRSTGARLLCPPLSLCPVGSAQHTAAHHKPALCQESSSGTGAAELARPLSPARRGSPRLRTSALLRRKGPSLGAEEGARDVCRESAWGGLGSDPSGGRRGPARAQSSSRPDSAPQVPTPPTAWHPTQSPGLSSRTSQHHPAPAVRGCPCQHRGGVAVGTTLQEMPL